MSPIRLAYNSFEKRLRSFSKVDLRPRFAQLASAGFWFNYARNTVDCHFCSAHAYNFLSDKDPNIFHAKTSPDCMFIRRKFGDVWIDNALNNYYTSYNEHDFLCKICLVRKIFCFFRPCGHAVCCKACFFSLDYCPYCKQGIRSYQQLYY